MGLYDRQETLKLKTPSITIVGCGGIGFWVAKYAAMSGIEKIWAFDPDTIEDHNLNRLDVPERFVGKNKSDVVKLIINTIRPECSVYTIPGIFNEAHTPGTDWLIDCTDKMSSQLENQRIAKKQGMKYVKAGYDGEEMSIHDAVAEWGDAEDGYQTIPSWVVPASIIAALTVAKVMKYNGAEVVTNIKGLFRAKRV